MSKFLFVSRSALIHDLAWEVLKERHEVKYFIQSKADKDVADGFVPKTDDWEKELDWAEVVVFDDNDFGAAAERLRKEGKSVVGGSIYTDRLNQFYRTDIGERWHRDGDLLQTWGLLS